MTRTQKCIRHLLAPCLFVASGVALADDWQTAQGISYRCGGVGAESQAEIKSEERAADAQLVLTAGGERSFLNDVQVTVASADKQHTASWQASGPICLLKLPAGNFTVDASYRDERRSAPVNRKPAKAGSPPPQVINFKPS